MEGTFGKRLKIEKYFSKNINYPIFQRIVFNLDVENEKGIRRRRNGNRKLRNVI